MKYSLAAAIVTIVGLAKLASPVEATAITFTNNCNFAVYYHHVWHEGEDPQVYVIAPNGGESSQTMIEPYDDNQRNGSVIKLHKGAGLTSGILQFEYTKEYDSAARFPGVYWDLSHVDGDSPGVPGRSPFRDDNVMAIPIGAGRGVGSCVDVFCEAGEICYGSYQFDKDDVKCRYCPLELDSFEVEFCPIGNGARKRGLEFSA
ncbi:hypothetical protein IFR05_015254 [Cadophora sp. M221]|nr:hypothetical protein IFR05_015254 [Cadophora sp. M221]